MASSNTRGASRGKEEEMVQRVGRKVSMTLHRMELLERVNRLKALSNKQTILELRTEQSGLSTAKRSQRRTEVKARENENRGECFVEWYE